MPKMENMFFEYRYVYMRGDKFCISRDSEVVSETECYAAEYAKKVLYECPSDGRKIRIKMNLGISDDIKTAVGNAFSNDDESYALEIKQD